MPEPNPNSIWSSPQTEEPIVIPQRKQLAVGQGKPLPPDGGHSFWRGPVWFAIGLLVIVIGVAAYYFLTPTQGLQATVTLSTNPPAIVSGDQFTLSVAFANDSGATMKGATISVVLPSDVVSVDDPSSRVVMASLGDVAAGDQSHEDFTLAGVGAPNTVANFTGKLVYQEENSSANFETDGTLNVAFASQPAVTLNIAGPPTVLSGQNFPVTVNYQNTTNHPIQNLSIAMVYPPAFNFSQANATLPGASAPQTTSASAGANGSGWNLGTIPANATGTIAIAGNIIGTTNASYPIEADLVENLGGQTYTLENPVANIVLGSSPLSFTLSLNNSSNYIAEPGDDLAYTLSFTNNSSVAFQNIIISANLKGAMFDPSSLQSDGTFNSISDTITWNAADNSQLSSLAPGQSGSVGFTVHAKNAFPIRLLSDKNYSVAVNARLTTPTVPPGTEASSTISVANLTTKFGGQISLGANGYFSDPLAAALATPLASSSAGTAGASGTGQGGSASSQSQTTGITKNTGPYPPAANQPTQYTIHWLVTNYATDAQNVTISADLQSGTTCTGEMVIPASTTFACDPTNGQVTWTIPFVAATTGITGKPLTAVFQVVNTPGVNEVGQDVTLLGPSSLTATDVFTGQSMQASAPAITTELPYDTSVPGGENRQVTE